MHAPPPPPVSLTAAGATTPAGIAGQTDRNRHDQIRKTAGRYERFCLNSCSENRPRETDLIKPVAARLLLLAKEIVRWACLGGDFAACWMPDLLRSAAAAEAKAFTLFAALLEPAAPVPLRNSNHGKFACTVIWIHADATTYAKFRRRSFPRLRSNRSLKNSLGK